MEFIQALLKNDGSFLLILARVAAFTFALPFIGGRGAPATVKVMLVLAITVVLFPFLRLKTAPLNLVTLATWLFSELLVGVAIGMAARFVLAAVEVGGEVIGIQMGFGIANVFDPITNQQASLIGQALSLVAVLIFFVTGAHHFTLQALVYSFEIVPPFSFYPSGPFVNQLIRMGSQMFILGLKIAAPLTMVLLMLNVSMGIMARVVPQMHIFMFSFSVTIGVGLIVLGATLSLTVGFFGDQMRGLDRTVADLLIGMRQP